MLKELKMSDIIYYKNGEETFRISPPTDGTKCPETKLEVKKMTEIEKVKGEIKMLQSKLSFLEEIERHNAKPKMHLENEGEFGIVSYDGGTYYRLEYPKAIFWYKRQKTFSDLMLVHIVDLEAHRLLEDKWNNEVITQKNIEPECPDEPEENEWRDVALKFGRKLPVIIPYGYDELSPNAWFRLFTYDNYMNQRDKESGYYPSSQTPEPYCPDELEYDLKEGTAPPEPTPSAFRQKLFDGIKSVFYDPDYERTHWKQKVNMAVDEVLTHFYDVIPNKYEVIPNKKEIVSDFEKGWNCCVVNIEMCMEHTDD
jgi:hypothetical protein